MAGDAEMDGELRFDPVPSASNRHDGWTPERQRGFIAALAMIGIVTWAAEAVGMSRKSAYELLKRAGPDSSFARIWREAQAIGRSRGTFTAIDRALNGVEVPYYYGGRQRGTRRVYDDRLLAAALRAIERLQHGEE
jgi:hypothetical protein